MKSRPSLPQVPEGTTPPEIPVRSTAPPSDLKPVSDIPTALAILPIRNAVLFPGMVLPLSIGRSSSKKLLAELSAEQQTIGVFTQRSDKDGEPGPDDLFAIGVAAKVIRVMTEADNNTVAIVNVLGRVRLTKPVATAPYIRSEVEELHSISPESTPEWLATVATLRDTAVDYLAHKQDVPDQVSMFVRNLDDGGRLADFIAGGLDFSVAEKQGLLEELDVVKRIRSVQSKVAHQLHVAELQDKIEKDVHDQFTDQQRRAYLHEQLKAIQKELGESSGETEDQVGQLRKKLAAAAPPAQVTAQAERELSRLAHMPQGSAEYSVVTSYVDTLASLPWNHVSKDNLDLRRARRILNRDHFGLEKVKRRLMEHLAVRKLKPDGHSPILLLLGPPGVGKTSLGQSIAKALGRKFVRISLGGVHDEADIRGHRRTYIGAMPGRLMEEIRRAGTRNPVVMLDELDKLGRDFRGDPSSALLEVLDPHQNHSFTDHFLDVPFDLSQVLFIATANDLSTIPGPLRDRLEILELSSYTEKEKREIGRRFLAPRQLGEHGLTARNCVLPPDILTEIIQGYTREAGVRELERQIASLCRAAAAKIAEGTAKKVTATAKFVAETLGPARFEFDKKNALPHPGVVTGLAWTPFGGEILHIEALKYAGTGQVKLTGQLGDVMKESVSAAVSLVRTHAKALGIAADAFKDTDLHLHVPQGAVPKDGPSAGVAMFTALASLFTDRPVRSDIAMTGEISLRELVLPIGGLKEKTLAALRAGIHTVIAPKANRKDLADLPPDVVEKIRFVWVETAGQVLRAALVPKDGKTRSAKSGAKRKQARVPRDQRN
ncbi:MAG: endopeptidase La [Verrucomicrobiales bacterium]|nr:endopeptidase La [Verrucomicrobiales bacterium]